jgi:hypothetical protein
MKPLVFVGRKEKYPIFKNGGPVIPKRVPFWELRQFWPLPFRFFVITPCSTHASSILGLHYYFGLPHN